MRVVKKFWAVGVAGALLVALVAGCQIEQDAGPVGELRHVKLSPDLNLNAAPPGHIYELWVLSIEIIADTLPPIIGEPVPVMRFQWDPYLYAASDANGNFLPLTSDEGMEVGMDLTPFFVAFLTIEPINDPIPQFPNGPIFVAQRVDPLSHVALMRHPFDILHSGQQQGGFGFPEPAAGYMLISQSNKKGIPGAQWRDNQTEGNGIWFCEPRLDDLIVLDSAGGWDSYTQTFVTQAGAYQYNVWIGRAHPESSFSNFGLVYANREPNFEFQNGSPVHNPGRFGPGVALGQDPVFEGGSIVGYRYIANAGLDTCVIRIDNPALTRCNRDTFDSLEFDNEDVLPRTFTTTNGDTTIVSTLGGIVDLGNEDLLNQITANNGFILEGWEYEAWLVFTDASGLEPVSLGRFDGPMGFDSGNPYTNSGFMFDSNFACPGEDFLNNIPGVGGPLNVITDPRVEKLWITIEPVLFADPEPNKPNKQLIYLSQFIPKNLPNTDFPRRAMVVRDINPDVNGLNEGNFFPTITLEFLPPPEN